MQFEVAILKPRLNPQSKPLKTNNKEFDPFDGAQTPDFSGGLKAPLRVNPEQAPA
jgi:hypothetical protein